MVRLGKGPEKRDGGDAVTEIRCKKCKRKLFVLRPGGTVHGMEIRCPKCGYDNVIIGELRPIPKVDGAGAADITAPNGASPEGADKRISSA
jgi:phage FluMu protein Com